MSSKQNHTINLGNYEEFFILYMDNELSAEQTAAVDAFLLQHPHLAEELELLMSTKLSPESLSFAGKEELLSPAMKLNAVDEALLLYIDNELPVAEKGAVEQKIEADKDYALQHSLLMQTRLDAGEKILHPNKKELYRHTERAVVFKTWMRMAAAVVLLLLASWFFFLNKNESAGFTEVVVTNGSPQSKPQQGSGRNPAQQKNTALPALKQEAAPATGATAAKAERKAPRQEAPEQGMTGAVKEQAQTSTSDVTGVALQRREAIQLNTPRLKVEPSLNDALVNKTIAPTPVTLKIDSSYNRQNTPLNNPEVDWAVETEKKAPARGFFRKVSRFIERKTGIGTVNDDNELLIGAVALKLK